MTATPHPSEPDGHVFDQTNGVLGDDTDVTDHPARDTETDAPRFGIPPLTSL